MKLKIIIGLTIMASGRAMTIAFIGRAGDGGVGDPPAVWLMPLIGDAVVGLSALVIAFLIWKRPTPGSWVAAVVWSAIGVFDALAALIIETSAPWPEFFMLEVFGRPMFLGAAALHLAIIYLLAQPEPLASFGLSPSGRSAQPAPHSA